MSFNKNCVTCWEVFAMSIEGRWIGEEESKSSTSESEREIVRASGSRERGNRRTCSVCSEKKLQMWESGRKRHQKEKDIELALQSSLTFLRLPFDNEPAARTLGGDVSIIVQGSTHQPLHAHKFILASKSLVLCKMFETDMLEKETDIFQINDASFLVVHAVVKFCYTAEIDFTERVTAEDVLAVAHKYAIDLLTKLCERHLITTISKENLPKRLMLARKFEVSDLLSATSRYFKNNFNNVIDDVLGEFC